VGLEGMSVVKEIEVNKIEDFEEWVEYLEMKEWDSIAVSKSGSGKILTFRGGPDNNRRFIQFMLYGQVVDRVRIFFSKDVVITEGIVSVDKMLVVINIEKFDNGLADIDVRVVKARCDLWFAW
jgi:hypothetical protein